MPRSATLLEFGIVGVVAGVFWENRRSVLGCSVVRRLVVCTAALVFRWALKIVQENRWINLHICTKITKFAHTFHGYGKLCIYIDGFASCCLDCSGVFVVDFVAGSSCALPAQGARGGCS